MQMVEKARMFLRLVATGIIISITMPEVSTCNAAPETPETPLVLENPRSAVKIDRRNGALLSIRDREQDVAYPLSGIGFVVTTDTGSIQAEKAVEARTKQDAVELHFAGGGLDIALHYHLGEEDRFVEKWLEIKASIMRLAEALVAAPLSGKDSSRPFIINGTDWFDTEGRPIRAHDGHINRVQDTFYWYGSSYAGNPSGKFGTAAGFGVWNGIQVYCSKDLVNWTYQGVALPRPKKGWGVVGTAGRAHVIYNEKTRKYVMWYWYHTTYPTVFAMVAASDTPVGPFKVEGPREVGSQTGFGSDLNVFKDDDGKAYLVYTDHHRYDSTKRFDKGRSQYAILIDRLSDDYLESKKDGVIAIPSGGEAPAMAKYRGKYIVAGSGVNGWAPTETTYVVSDSPLGPYGKPGIMTEQKTWGGQITSFLHIKESDTLMAMCDQWWNPDKTDLDKSRYLWLPVNVNPETGVAKMIFRKEWDPLRPVERRRPMPNEPNE